MKIELEVEAKIVKQLEDRLGVPVFEAEISKEELERVFKTVSENSVDILGGLSSVQPMDPHIFSDAYHSMRNRAARGTIFPVLSLDRSKIKWEDYLYAMTPCEQHQNPETKQRVWFKREDYFAPLSDYTGGVQGINGSKLRQAIWLLQQHILEGGSPDLIHGTVMGSPQSPMATAVSAHFGGHTTTVLGATTAKTCLRAEMVSMSAWFGSEFNFVGTGYNATIQPRCTKLRDATKPDAYYLEYGITLDHTVHSAKRLADFHSLGGAQVQNIPDHITDLIIPAGSCNSCCSIFTGLALYPKPNIKNIWLVGIGPNRLKFIEDRLDVIGNELGLPHIRAWIRDYRDNPDFGQIPCIKGIKSKSLIGLMHGLSTSSEFLDEKIMELQEPRFTVHHWDLHTTNWVRYNDLMDYQWGTIELHPRYEGKVMRLIQERAPELLNENTLFWIVGSKPRTEPMMVNCPELGAVPETVKVNDFKPVN